jgi:DNA-binding transcriptional ArsR family regulator
MNNLPSIKEFFDFLNESLVDKVYKYLSNSKGYQSLSRISIDLDAPKGHISTALSTLKKKGLVNNAKQGEWITTQRKGITKTHKNIEDYILSRIPKGGLKIKDLKDSTKIKDSKKFTSILSKLKRDGKIQSVSRGIIAKDGDEILKNKKVSNKLNLTKPATKTVTKAKPAPKAEPKPTPKAEPKPTPKAEPKGPQKIKATSKIELKRVGKPRKKVKKQKLFKVTPERPFRKRSKEYDGIPKSITTPKWSSSTTW